MIAHAIRFILSNYSLTFLVVGLLCAVPSLFKYQGKTAAPVVFESFLAYYCLFTIGFSYFYNFVMHVFFAARSAAFIGWADSPFQYEVGFASLGFAVVGFLAFKKDFGLRLAAVIGPAFFLWGAAGGHVYEMITRHNFSPGNAGVIFWMDLLIPVVGLFLLFGWRRSQSSSAGLSVS